jgi:ceramide glucosyltransferase
MSFIATSTLAPAIAILAAIITVSGMVYGALALLGARAFLRDDAARPATSFAPPVSILKPLKGVDLGMFAGLASHCTQQYAGEYEIVFGVSSLSDPAIAQIARLRVEHPQVAIRVVECPLRLGSSGKVSNLAQMLPHARFEHIVVNDSDIRVGPHYLTRILQPFVSENTGLVTVPYIGAPERGLWSRLEAIGIAVDLFPGVLSARLIESGMRYGLGSTLATTRAALARIGGFEALLDELADDYQMGARMAAAGLRVELVREVVATGVPAYTLRGFAEHQLRWTRTVRDARPRDYIGLGLTHMLPWALLTVIATGGALWSFTLLSFALLMRVAVALQVGVGVLRDGQVLRDLHLLPLRDFLTLFFWAWGFASDEVVWRGETFRLHKGRMIPVEHK